jgi:succinate dehydrogenase / fumarate reductase flavoprotein subunit
MEADWRKTLLVCRTAGDDPVVPDVSITREDQVPMREDLLELIDIEELEKYFTPEELANHSSRRGA